MSTLLKSLNEAQQEAVQYKQGPCMVIAGAGSGKTRVLTYRVAYLIETHKVSPFSILALTFTNKAAREIVRRVNEVVDTRGQRLWIGTFHALFARLLRKEGAHLGYTSDFSIYDRDDSLALAKEILKEAHIDEEKCKPSYLLHQISRAKQDLIPWKAFMQAEEDEALPFRLGSFYKSYVERCYKANAMDFDDLLFNMHVLFRQQPEVLSRYQEQFQYVLIDEFQDTNRSQYLTARALAAPQHNICVVGDDSQSIYAFRGANIENILNFQKDYPQVKLLRLEQNYRSTVHITEAAGSLIAKNAAQIPKKLWTANPKGAPLRLLQAQNDNEEGRLVASSIFEQKHSFGHKTGEIAILYRTHSQSRALEEALRRIQIPYRVVGGLSFYQRKEVKDMLAYMRFVLNPRDGVALRRIINLPRRGIGETTMERLRSCAMDYDMSLWEVMQRAEKLLDKRTQKLIGGFVALLSELMEAAAASHNAHELAKQIGQDTGLLGMYYEDRSPEGIARYANIEELLGAIHAFSEEETREDITLAAFLQEVALITDADQSIEGAQNAVQLMTIHMAKGLEFKVVFVTGLEESLFPSYHTAGDKKALEEERRLFYVAMTRAKERLFISYARQRYQYGSLRACDPSRFLSEIDEHYFAEQVTLLEAASAKQPLAAPRREGNTSGAARLRPLRNLRQDLQNTTSAELQSLKPGMKVEHRLFGTGKVIDVSGGNSPRARIDFATHGEKTLLLQYARLKVVHAV